ncbi:hypothetical protein [Isoptericola dokdonensis]|uniref:DUF732 domain-containing protein n=1 Tax=Isoptericola dokdonensis DS-3 TaxID=1300344 RepID=A0A161HYG6_9MICO|nr:hypothetical protein [Isoptericola dokdonensis]ANC31473.1 hypothetical protein I598_1925 [Isoptericola dokdonensis DS-3]
MRKHLGALALAASVAVLVAACSSGDDAAPADETTPDETTVGEAAESAGGGIPEPTDEQADALVDELAAAVPALADDPDATVDAARNVCSSILGGTDDDALVQGATLRFDDGSGSVTEDDAAQLVEVVRGSEWCA